MTTKKTLAMVQTAPRKLEARELPLPELTDDSALLRAAIVVQDLEQSKRFYRDALGFTVSFDGDITRPTVKQQLGLLDSQTAHFVVLKGSDQIRGENLGSAMIGLLMIANPSPPVMTRPDGADLAVGETMLALMTSDIQSAYRRLREQRARILLPPTKAPDGSESEMVVHDPDGVRVHLVERHHGK